MSDNKIYAIVAMTKDRVIGKPGALPWHIPEDLKRFKLMTDGQTVIMGRRTYDSIGRPLPNRNNVVLDNEGSVIDGADVCKSIPEALRVARSYGKKVFVIGGASVYEQMLPLVDVLYVSHVKKDYEGTVYFPEYDEGEWESVDRKEYDDFVAATYQRVKKKVSVKV